MGGHFPDTQQTLLLKSALDDRLKAIRYFADWLESNKLDKLNPASETFLSDFMDSIDLGSQRLLPMVIHNLGDDAHPYFKFLIGTRKNYWVRNKQIEHRAQQVEQILEKNGISFMRIKGLDLASGFYKNPGLRPMYNGDLLIRDEHKNIVFELAEKGLFENKANTYRPKAKHIAPTIHLEYEGNIAIDIHWSVFREYAHVSNVSDFIWQKAAKEMKAGVEHYKISATHALFVSLVQGSRFETVPPIRWVIDAGMIIGSSYIDWDEILELTKRFHYKPFLKRALPYLVDQHQFELSAGFLEKLNKLQVSEAEEKYYRSVSANNRKYGLLSLMWFDVQKKLHFHNLFLKGSNISVFGYLFTWYFNHIKAELFRQ